MYSKAKWKDISKDIEDLKQQTERRPYETKEKLCSDFKQIKQILKCIGPRKKY